jgi:hypothetical protein
MSHQPLLLMLPHCCPACQTPHAASLSLLLLTPQQLLLMHRHPKSRQC